MKIEHAQEQDFRQVLSVINTTISTIYPKYYPAGVVRFFSNTTRQKKYNNQLKTERYIFFPAMALSLEREVSLEMKSGGCLFCRNTNGKGTGNC
ncbi:hypothetical protein ABC733_01280 [Mangrovibacter sp. SLW1]